MKKGFKMTEEQKRKNSETQKKVWDNPELRKKHSEIHKGQIAWNKGKKNIYSEDTKKIMGESHLGKTPWNKGKKGVQIGWNKGKKGVQIGWNKGKFASEESKRKMSETQKKLWQNPEHRKRMSESAKSSINKGKFKEGHRFSEEIKQKIREYTLKQYESGIFPKQTNTLPERQIKIELIKRGYKEGIDFIHQYKFNNKFMCDFCFPKQKIIIEVYGDFWHANPKKYSIKKLLPHQIKGVNRDKSKEAYIRKVDNNSWVYIYFWESDIKEDVSRCVDVIEKILLNKKMF